MKDYSYPLSIFQDTPFYVSPFKAANSDLGIQIGAKQTGILEGNPVTISLAQIGKTQIGAREVNVTDIGISEISISQNSIPNTTISRGATSAITSSEISTTKIYSTEIGSIQVNCSQHSPTQIDSIQINPSKVTLPSSISLQQLLSSHLPAHNLTSDLLSNPKSTAFTLFDPTFNINFQIADLPTGQLAEAQITDYDSLGRPNGGTILIDHDANGIGWFIDPTPNDNSEFAQTLTDTAYRATTGDAAGKYDLFTGIKLEFPDDVGRE